MSGQMLFPHRWGVVVESEFVDTTKPGDAWETCAPTGRRRAAVVLPVPVWLANAYGLIRSALRVKG